jgi:hypothetical protein
MLQISKEKLCPILLPTNASILCPRWVSPLYVHYGCTSFKREPPSEIRKGLMVRIVAHCLQEAEFGSLNDANCRRLRQLANAFKASPKANEPCLNTLDLAKSFDLSISELMRGV